MGTTLASLQELLLFTVLRLHAELPTQVDEPPTIELETIRHTVQELKGMSTTRKYIRNVSNSFMSWVDPDGGWIKKCDTFLEWSESSRRGDLKRAVKDAKSPSVRVLEIKLTLFAHNLLAPRLPKGTRSTQSTPLATQRYDLLVFFCSK